MKKILYNYAYVLATGQDTLDFNIKYYESWGYSVTYSIPTLLRVDHSIVKVGLGVQSFFLVTFVSSLVQAVLASHI